MPDRLLTIVLSCGLTLMALFVITVGKDLLIPIAVSLLLWLLINSLANFQGRIKLSGKPLSGWLRLSSSLVIIGTALVLVGELIAHNVPAIVEKAPQLQADLNAIWAKLSARLGQEKLHEVAGIVSGFKLSSILVASAQACAKIVENAGTILVYVMFMLVEQNIIDKKLTILFPDEGRRKAVRDFLETVQRKVQAYLSTTALMSLLGGGVTYVVLAVIGVEFAAFWGLFTFLLSFIPTVGALASIVFPALLALAEFPTLWPFAIVVVGLGCAHLIIGNVIEPRFIGHTLNLSPLAVIISLSIWGAIWGVPGMFLCVPLTVILMIIFSQFEVTKPIAVALSAEGEV
jgi:AI-2 transport protein TqsA